MYPIIFVPIVSPGIFSMIVNILPYGVYSTDIWDINVVLCHLQGVRRNGAKIYEKSLKMY
jgi:hypothetical protein